MNITGLHHVTAIASDPQRNLDFYVGLLGLRLVKRTINFDDPGTYHFYFADGVGTPGTILTFFPWPDARRGVRGVGEIEATVFTIPGASVGYWLDRLKEHHVGASRAVERFGDEIICFADPDGMLIELIASAPGDEVQPWHEGPVPVEHSIRGLHSVSAALERREGTTKLLIESFGYRLIQETGNRVRFAAPGEGGTGKTIELVCTPGGQPGRLGPGSVHHIAFRVPDNAGQRAWRDKIVSLGYSVSPVMDRVYFRSSLAGTSASADRGSSSKDNPPNRGDIMNRSRTLDFRHTFVPGRSARTLLLLHGTGGDETDLIPVGRVLDPEAALLSPRGKVLENGMPRFFRRLAAGIFDEEDLVRRTHELADFIELASENYRFDQRNLLAVGYSNGANIAASLLLLRPGTLGGAALLRPMVPLVPEKLPDLKGAPVLIAAANHDTIASPDEARRLAALLRNAGADLTVSFENAGHGLTDETIETVKRWLT